MTTNVIHIQQAYHHINSGDYQAAIGILESLINVDTVNVEAWEAYMQISRNSNQLDELCDRVLQINKINTVDRESILDYYYFLREKIKLYRSSDEIQKDIKFEVVDQFSYPLSSSIPKNNREMNTNIEQRLVIFLHRAILILYLILMAVTFNLLAINNNLGYFAVLELIFTVLVGKGKYVPLRW